VLPKFESAGAKPDRFRAVAGPDANVRAVPVIFLVLGNTPFVVKQSTCQNGLCWQQEAQNDLSLERANCRRLFL
jgi:hypothetical protein